MTINSSRRRFAARLNSGVRPMRIVLAGLSLLLAGCSTLNVLSGPDDFCRQMHADYRNFFDDAITREIRLEPPNGALTKPYSRELWDDYWNDRIYYMWDIGPDDCSGTCRGATGPQMLQYAITKRRDLGLPEINLDSRNGDKGL